MRIHQLELVAYGPFPGTVSIDFDQLSAEGIFLLNGPTGSGKSSILDAISYALYGTTSSGRRDLKSRFAPADRVPRVTLECTIQGKRYRIERQPAYLRPKKKGSGLMQENAKCFIERFDPATESWGQDPLATRHKDAADFMLSLLGLNAQQFNQVILLPQGQFQRFLTASSQEREEVLKKLFATEEFQAIQTYLDQQAKEAKEAASQALRELEQLEALADGALAQAQIERAYRLLGWDLPERESEDESEEAHRSLDQLAPFYRLQAKDLARLSQALQARAQENREELKALKAEENRLAQLLETWKDYLKLSDQLEKLEAARPQQEQRQAALGSYRSAQRLLPLYQNAQRMQQEASSCQQKLSRGAEELEQLSCWAQEQLSSQALEAQAWASLKNKLGPDSQNLADRLDLADLGEQAAQLAQQLNQLKEEEAKLKDQLKEQQALAGQLARKEEALQVLAVQAQKLGEQVKEKQEQLIDQAQLAISLHAAQEAHQKAQEAYQLAEKRDQAQQQQALASQRAQQAEGLRLEANAHYNHLQALRFSGALQGLVASLEEGKPCPVCGSPSHPNPAPLEGPQQEVSDRSLKEAQQKRDRAEEQARSSLQELARVKATLDQLLEAGALDLAEAKDLQQQAAGELRQQEEISRTQAQLIKTLQNLERELATLEEKQQEGVSQLAIIQDRKDQLEGQMSQLEARLSSQQEGPDFRARAQQLQIL
ncbi:MAG: SMC family ATPase, partial [Rothia sp. (in: high G+C Gram-positive bacteria)]|nr:SMC family ATPase [Rothia sp. (in: high G+C Gram-positive bacteria)]